MISKPPQKFLTFSTKYMII